MRPFSEGATTIINQFMYGAERPHRVQKRKKKLVGTLFEERRRRRQQEKEKKRDEKKKSNSIRKKSEEFKWAIIITSNRTTAHNSLVSKSTLPELGCIRFRDAKLIAGEDTVGKDGFKFAKHMREDKTQFC
jgi:hypothetical protein